MQRPRSCSRGQPQGSATLQPSSSNIAVYRDERVQQGGPPRIASLPVQQRTEKVGVLLLNLGGPETLDDVQPFLFNLFNDPDIIRLPRSGMCKLTPLVTVALVWHWLDTKAWLEARHWCRAGCPAGRAVQLDLCRCGSMSTERFPCPAPVRAPTLIAGVWSRWSFCFKCDACEHAAACMRVYCALPIVAPLLPAAARFLQPVLATLISTLRASKSAEGYKAIGGGSPLRRITEEQGVALRKALQVCSSMRVTCLKPCIGPALRCAGLCLSAAALFGVPCL